MKGSMVDCLVTVQRSSLPADQIDVKHWKLLIKKYCQTDTIIAKHVRVSARC